MEESSEGAGGNRGRRQAVSGSRRWIRVTSTFLFICLERAPLTLTSPPPSRTHTHNPPLPKPARESVPLCQCMCVSRAAGEVKVCVFVGCYQHVDRVVKEPRPRGAIRGLIWTRNGGVK